MNINDVGRTFLPAFLAIAAMGGCSPAQAQPPASPSATSGATAPAAASAASSGGAAGADAAGTSPWGASDEIGMLNMMTAPSRLAILARIDGSKVYDLAVDYFQGMPSFDALGDPRYQIWLTHTPRGTGVDDPVKVGRPQNDKVSYTGDAISMYTHTGTHIDSLNHFGLHGRIYNGFRADEHLGDHGWQRNGPDKMPPIIARGVLLDIAALKGVAMLPNAYAITSADLKDALARQHTNLEPGDVALIRTGRMSVWPDRDRFVADTPGLTLESARWLAEEKRVMVIGSDALAPDQLPSGQKDNWIPVHTYLLAQRGIPLIEVIDLEALARDRVYEFAFLGAPLRLRGASGAPFRPIAFPLRAVKR
ncbi:cyclase family protein [Pendulispora albinea]|uniref:Cyclase family protein n=1 Tax=Pendulispora albinea TaxID=2741071 RepID=A0ABZ2M6R0_9BACT